MPSRQNLLSVLQTKINAKGNGILLDIELINNKELRILCNNAQIIFEDFEKIVKNIVELHKNVEFIPGKLPFNNYLILDQDETVAKKIAETIYDDLQKYCNKIYPELHLVCVVGSIKFNAKNKTFSTSDVALLIDKLTYGMHVNHSQANYYSFDHNPFDLDSLKKKNNKLSMLKKSLADRTIKFAFQPVVTQGSLNVAYYECLLRIPDDEGKYFSIGSFVNYAEDTGVINFVDETAIKMVIDELNKDLRVTLSVNISTIGTLNDRLLAKIKTLLNEFEVGDRLIFEMTETSFNQNLEKTKRFILELKKFGCRFAIDDFGTGYTSFKQLLNLPIDIIKIDGLYIKDIATNKKNQAFVNALAKLSAEIGAKSVAEYVENEEIVDALRSCNIDYMQGNYFGSAKFERE